MDGAIIVPDDMSRLAYANVQLMPDPEIPSNETGTRHRTAERVAKQTGAMVVSVSQQRLTVTLFVGDARYPLEPIADILAKTNQAVATLDTYVQRFQQVLTRLTALEFQNAVVLDDVLVVLQRAEMTTRMAEEIERDCVELGTEGRLIRMQLQELVADVPTEKASVILDYQERGGDREAQQVLLGLASLPVPVAPGPGRPGRAARLSGRRRLHRLRRLARAATGSCPTSRRLPEPIVDKVVADMSGLEAIVRASQRELEAVEGVGPARAREIREGLRRLQEHNLVDRYLQL